MSEREKLKPEEKVKIVIKYIAGEVSISGAAAKAGVDQKTLQRCNNMISVDELKEGQETWYISQAIDRFCELHPNVSIEISAYNDNAQLMNDFKAATRAGYGPDIAKLSKPALLLLNPARRVRPSKLNTISEVKARIE